MDWRYIYLSNLLVHGYFITFFFTIFKQFPNLIFLIILISFSNLCFSISSFIQFYVFNLIFSNCIFLTLYFQFHVFHVCVFQLNFLQLSVFNFMFSLTSCFFNFIFSTSCFFYWMEIYETWGKKRLHVFQYICIIYVF